MGWDGCASVRPSLSPRSPGAASASTCQGSISCPGRGSMQIAMVAMHSHAVTAGTALDRRSLYGSQIRPPYAPPHVASGGSAPVYTVDSLPPGLSPLPRSDIRDLCLMCRCDGRRALCTLYPGIPLSASACAVETGSPERSWPNNRRLRMIALAGKELEWHEWASLAMLS
jgi:hypothetical protein